MLKENIKNSDNEISNISNAQQQSAESAANSAREIDAVIVGAGFSGMYMLHRLRKMGLKAQIFEAADGVGGTWYWNRYPGARCDVESMDYSFSFSPELEQEWEWTERYATQPELLQYANHIADRFDLRRDIQFETRVTLAEFDDATNRWRIETDKGNRVTARFCIMATGCLSSWQMPNFKGRDTFRGKTYHTGNWPHEGVDFTGQRVAVIGTGSSAIQAIPIIAEQAAHMYVYQRTPNYSVPAGNAPLDPKFVSEVKANYADLRHKARLSPVGMQATITYGEKSVLDVTPEELHQNLETLWGRGGFDMLFAYTDTVLNPEANARVADFIRIKIRQIVKDPEIAEQLAPADYPVGTKRICVDTNYYATFNRPNVTLINVKNRPIEEITEKGVMVDGKVQEVDCIVYATGFDAMTGALSKINIRGRNNQKLNDAWSAGPRSYLGLGVAGFPNLFTITGPGSPSVLSNMITSIEQHVDWIADCIGYMQERHLSLIEPAPEAQDAWVDHVNEVANMTLYPQANSWYLGANVPGKPRVFMPYAGGVGNYRLKCDEVAAKGYEGFLLTPENKGNLIPEISQAIKIEETMDLQEAAE